MTKHEIEEIIRNEPPLTSIELKRRLKHIAGLCYGLVCDIGRMEIRTEFLENRVEELKAKLAQVPKSAFYNRNYRKPAEQIKRPKTSEAMLRYWERRRAEEAAQAALASEERKTGFQD